MIHFINSLWVGLGAILGALLRFFIAQQFQTFSPVVGIALINLSGSFLLGLFWQFQKQTFSWPYLNLFLAVGFLGSYTTFSTFSKDNFELWQTSKVLAVGNMFGQVLLGVLFFYLGTLVVRYFWPT